MTVAGDRPDGDSQGVRWSEISIEGRPNGRGVIVKGLTPLVDTPTVEETELPAVYTVKQRGSPKRVVDVSVRGCTCSARNNGDWCIHLRAAAVYHNRGLDA